MDRNNVVVYDPITAALFLDGGYVIILALIVAALIGVGVYHQLEKRVKMYGFWYRHMGKLSIAVSVLSLYLMHLSSVRGWL